MIRSVVASSLRFRLMVVGIAIVVGVPVGLVVGARIWTPIANAAHVVVLTVAPWSIITLYVLATVVATALLTVIPASRARRLRAADTLRTE